MSRILIIHPDADVRSAIEAAIRQRGGRPFVIETSPTIADGVRRAKGAQPHVVFVDVDADRDLVIQAVADMRLPGRFIVGLYNPLLLRGDWSFIRDFTRAGIGDFVQMPPSEDEVLAALSSATRAEGRAPTEGRVIAFFSQQGGVGTTTLAVHTAAMLASMVQSSSSVVLFDAVVQFGAVAQCLGVSPLRDMAAFASDSAGGSALAACLTDEPVYGLNLLASPRDPLAGARIGPDDITRVLIELRRRFAWVIVDTPPVLDLLSMAVLDSADRTMVVTEAVTPTLLNTASLLRLLEQEGLSGDRLSVVLNRFSSFEGNLSERTVRERLGRPADHIVPYDRSFVVSANRGRPLIGQRMAPALQVALSSIAEDLIGRQARPQVVAR